MASRPDPGTAPDAWRSLGRVGPPDLTGVELRLLELRLRRPVRTARGVHRRRPIVLVRIDARSADGDVSGWGECAALADTTYDAEDATSALATLAEDLVPALLDPRGRTGGTVTVPAPSDLAAVREAAPRAPLAFAALEMAVADLQLRRAGLSFASLLGVVGRSVPVGAVAGASDSVEELLARVAELVHAGFARVKLKIGPGWDVEPVAAVVRAHPGLPVQVDANESYTEADRGPLLALDGFGLTCIEQPFHRDDLEAHARLARRMDTPICLDESADSPARVAAALAMQACSVVCIKPSRLGGIGAALSVMRACAADGVPVWLGGMFESSYGRGVNTTLAALPGVTWPGDLSPAPDYLVDDLVPAPELADRAAGRPVEVAVPAGPGLGPVPDEGTLDRLTVRTLRFDRDRSR